MQKLKITLLHVDGTTSVGEGPFMPISFILYISWLYIWPFLKIEQVATTMNSQ